MSTSVTWNGSSYTVPSTSEENWAGATKVDGLLIALVNHGFQKTGGTFTLSADADFGVTAGLKSIYYKSRGTVATTGVLRLGNAEVIAWMNAAGNANIPLTVNSSNQLTFNGTVVLSSAGVTQIAAGGTGQTTATLAFDALSPMTTLGDIIYGGASGTRTRLAGNITTTKKYLSQTGDSANSAAPSWAQVAFADLSGNATVAQGGTNLTSYTAGDLLYATGSTTLAKLPIGTANQVLQTNAGATAPEWVSNASAPDSSKELSNLSIAVSVATNACTIALKDKSGSDPSAGSPVKIGMRNATVTTGTYAQRSVTGALSVVIPSGTTIGTSSGKSETIYVYAIDNAGTVELGVSLKLFDEGSVQTSTSISGGASATTLYSTTGRTSKAIRLIGRFVATEGTAGTWATSPSEVSIMPFSQTPTVAASYGATGAQACNSAASTTFDFTGVTYYDTHGMVSTTTITIPVTGKYRISAQIVFGSASITKALLLRFLVFKNTVETKHFGDFRSQATDTYPTCLHGSTTMHFNAGDAVQIKVNHNLGSTLTSSTDGMENWLDIERIGN